MRVGVCPSFEVPWLLLTGLPAYLLTRSCDDPSAGQFRVWPLRVIQSGLFQESTLLRITSSDVQQDSFTA